MSTRQDDLSRLLGIMADAPLGGISLDEIQAATERTGEKWPLRIINGLMVALGGQVEHQKTRDRTTGSKITRYWLKRRS